MKTKYDYRYLFIWMCAGNIVQFTVNLIGEDRIKSVWSCRLWIFLFIITIPFSLYMLGKTKFGIKLEKYIRGNERLLNILGHVSGLLFFVYILYLVNGK